MCKKGGVPTDVLLTRDVRFDAEIFSVFIKGECKMKIYDISQELLTSRVYDGDPSPRATLLKSTSDGDPYNLTEISMCVHNGTHVDAPRHFIDGADGVDRMPLEKCVGYAFVVECDGDITDTDARNILARVELQNPTAAGRILVKGNATLTVDGARVLAENGVHLVGTESQSVGDENAPMAVHLVLLSAGIVLLEGLRLTHVPEGVYLLAAQPINIKDSDGAPTRAVLISEV